MSNAMHGATLVAQATTSPAAPAAANKPPRRPAAWRSRPPAPSSRPPTRCTARPPARRLGAARGHAGHGLPAFVAQSDFVGKSLFVILILMSLVTWYLILVKVASNVSMRNARATSEQVLECQLA